MASMYTMVAGLASSVLASRPDGQHPHPHMLVEDVQKSPIATCTDNTGFVHRWFDSSWGEGSDPLANVRDPSTGCVSDDFSGCRSLIPFEVLNKQIGGWEEGWDRLNCIKR